MIDSIKRISFFVITFLFTTFCVLGQNTPRLQKADSLSIITTLDSVINAFPALRHDHPREALQLTQKALADAQKIASIHYLAYLKYQLGVIYIDMGNLEKARDLLEASLLHCEKLNDIRGICLNYKFLGYIHNEIGNKNKGMNLLTQALELAKENHLEDEIPKIENNIGIIFLNQGHYDLAIEHFNNCFEMEKDIYAKVAFAMNMALAYQMAGNFEECVNLCHKSMKLCENSQVESCSLRPRSFLVDHYLRQDEYEKALTEAHFIRDEQRKLGLRNDELVTLNTIGLIHLESEAYYKAVEYFEKTLEIALEIDFQNVYMIYGNLSFAYEGMHNYQKAFEFLQLETKLKDSLLTEEKNRQIEDLLAKYEAEKKESEIERLKREKELQEIQLDAQISEFEKEKLAKNLAAKEKEYQLTRMRTAYDLQQISLEKANIAREKKEQEVSLLQKEKQLQDAIVQNQKAKIDEQNLIRNFLMAGAVIILVAGIIIVFVYQQKIRDKNLLAVRTEEVNKQKILELLRAQEIQTIRATISGSESEKQRISSELHDGIAGTLAGIKLGLSKIANETQNPKLAKYIKDLDETYNDVRTLSHHLTPPRIKDSSFTRLITKYISEVDENNIFNIDLLLHPEDELNKLPDNLKVEIYRIIQELLTNIIKHAKACLVEIQLNKTGDLISLIVEDDGTGFDKYRVKEGIGLSNIESRVSLLKGTIDIDTLPARGTIINIDVPINS